MIRLGCAVVILTLSLAVQAQQSTRIALGCCVDQSERQAVWDALNLAEPEVFALLGNGVAANADDMDDLLAAYEVFNRYRGPRMLRRNSAFVSTWGEDDYSIDGHVGADNPQRYAVRNHFLTFWREPLTSERMFQEHGIAKSFIIGEAPQRVQVILLDKRWAREPLKKRGLLERVSLYFDDNNGPLQVGDANRLLGEGQWQWLEQQLSKEAEIRILLSEMPFLAPQNGYPSWALFTQEQKRLFALLKNLNVKHVVLGHGGIHFGQIVKAPQLLDYPVWQVSSGTINRDNGTPYQFSQRQGLGEPSTRFGMIEITWSEQPTVTLSLRDVNGRPLTQTTINLRDLQ